MIKGLGFYSAVLPLYLKMPTIRKIWLLEEDREYYQYAMEVRLEEILTIASIFLLLFVCDN